MTSTSAIAQMYIRKQNIFTEKKIFPYAKMEDLRLDLLPKIRVMAQNHAGGQHPWTAMDDALVRKVNVDRYDDREIIKTNLIESYSQLLDFGRKNLPDKFFLEGAVNKSLRNTIVREMVSNTLMHREFTSSYTAKFVIEKDRMYVENANRATKEGFITVDNLEPNPKNPIIAAFFRNIGYADQLGSGVRKLFKYCKFYSGKEPEFVEGDVFRIIVPLDEEYSFDFGVNNKSVSETLDDKIATLESDLKRTKNKIETLDCDFETKEELEIVQLIKENPSITQKEIQQRTGISLGTVKRILPKLQKKGILVREGGKRFGRWIIK